MSNTVVNILQIVVSLLVIAIILVQVKGQGSGLFGSAEGSFRTRRGLELTLFRFTIFLVIVFIGLSIVSVRYIR
ncbi:MAG TPA: preprotein translocase subunit SecG [Dehalococcoidia bacterium]|nr:preprotein translocase subunit SecG [SAR202 cluster bacterium]HHZ63628.1 preprotein translocase subunit SecG [Dehalococcoidia bacterium]HIN72948.1 preprotein translocase subunit SecG [Dehalococcoidia bacterium]